MWQPMEFPRGRASFWGEGGEKWRTLFMLSMIFSRGRAWGFRSATALKISACGAEIQVTTVHTHAVHRP